LPGVGASARAAAANKPDVIAVMILSLVLCFITKDASRAACKAGVFLNGRMNAPLLREDEVSTPWQEAGMTYYSLFQGT
jgi:hypothetical protein